MNDSVGVRGVPGLGPYSVTPSIAASAFHSLREQRHRRARAARRTSRDSASRRVRSRCVGAKRREEVDRRRGADDAFVVLRAGLETLGRFLRRRLEARRVERLDQIARLPHSMPMCGP